VGVDGYWNAVSETVNENFILQICSVSLDFDFPLPQFSAAFGVQRTVKNGFSRLDR
jgi:hypothetical protein